MLKHKLPQQEQGFSLVEVLAAILIASLFVIVAMQMLAVASLFKARAQKYAEATTWIQADLENVKYQASNFQYTSLADNSATQGVSSIDVVSSSNFAVNDILKVGSDQGTYKITGVNTIVVGGISVNQFNISPSLNTSQVQGAQVTAITRCNVGATAGFAAGLQTVINPTNPSSILETSKLTNQTFNLKRTTGVSSNDPNVLTINYDVSPTSGGASVASFYTEVIPNAALECPK